MSVAELHALMPVGTPRGTAEAAILREYRSGRILQTSPGRYALAPARPPEVKRPSPPPPPTADEEAMWYVALEAWISEPETWDRTTLGPRPNEPGRRIPADIVAKGVDRSRKREARRREAEAAATARAAADAELRDPLIAATGGNLIRGPGRTFRRSGPRSSSFRSTASCLRSGPRPTRNFSRGTNLPRVGARSGSCARSPTVTAVAISCLVSSTHGRKRAERRRCRTRRRPARCQTTTWTAVATTRKTPHPGRMLCPSHPWMRMRVLRLLSPRMCRQTPLMRPTRRPLSRHPSSHDRR